MKRLRVAILLAALGALLALPGVAAADDAGLFAAYTGKQKSQVDPVARQYAKDARRWNRSGHTRRWSRAVIRDDRRMNRALSHVSAAVSAEQPSSANGTKAKANALKEFAAWRKANRIEMHGLRALIAGHAARARRLLGRAGRLQVDQTFVYERRAKRAFRAAGFKS
jgi:hypothetical protein